MAPVIVAHTAAAVRAAEEPLLAAGPPGALMELASFALATHVVRALRERGRPVVGTRVVALVGAGNNGGDALHAAAFLARRGAAASAVLLTPRSHAEGLAAAHAAGVRLIPVPDPATHPDPLVEAATDADVWLDGLTGIGAQGALRGTLARAVELLAALRPSLPIEPLVVAVDVPSGIGVDDGTVPGPAVPADLTVTMGVAKPGLLLPPAAALAGHVEVVDIGLGPELAGRDVAVIRLTPADAGDLWPLPQPADHKYTRGVLGLAVGSPRYPGAAVLATAGAVGTGLGMVRFSGADEVLRLVHVDHPEVVGALGRVQAWALGSGVDPSDAESMDRLAGHLAQALAEGLPVVLDAGALVLVGSGAPPLPPRVVLTPHAGELARLLAARGLTTDRGASPTRADVEAAPARWAREAAVDTGATVLLKGAVTVIAGPTGPVVAQDDAVPWLATAGAGDVLTGVLGALLAGCAADVASEASLVARLAGAAALVHGRAARRAAGLAGVRPGTGDGIGRPIGAGDVARALPATIGSILARGDVS